MDNNALVNNIRNLCSERGISISRLERDLFLSPGLISRWTKNVPTLDRIVDIAEYFNVPLDYIVTDSCLRPKDRIANRLIHTIYSKSIALDLIWKIWPESELLDTTVTRINKTIDPAANNSCFFCTYEKGYFFLTVDDLYASNPQLKLFALADKNSEPELCSDNADKLEDLYQYLYKSLHAELNVRKTENFINSFLAQEPSKQPLDNITHLRFDNNIVNE